ncbi:MAG: membrane protein insertase YidC [Verrucomicrobiota bacterium]
MDRKSIVILLASVALIVLWQPLMQKVYPPKIVSTNTLVAATNQIGTNLSGTTNTGNMAVATNAVPIAPMTNSAPEELISLTNELSIYTFTSHGGGLKMVELRKYPAAIDCRKSVSGEYRLASLNTQAPVPTLAILGVGESETATFHLSRNGNTVRAERETTNGVVLIKEFQIGTNYLVNAKVRFENRSAQTTTIPAHEIVVGTATPMSVKDESLTMGTFWFNGAKAEHTETAWFANRSFLNCVGRTTEPRTEFQDGQTNVVWGAVHNQFFALALVPKEPAAKFFARTVSLPPPSPADVAAEPKAVLHPQGIQSSLAYPALTLTANQGMERHYTIYAGPKEYNNLARIGDDMKNELDLLMDFGRYFGFFAKMLLLSMNGLHAMGMSYALAIILITVIIKALFWPLTAASTRSMKRMQTLQPQMKAIAEKYKDDPMKKNQKTMEFMRENKVSPLGGCLPMVLQIPVFIGFYQMIRSAIELRGASFLWACDLSQADTVAHIAGFPINPLPLIYGATALWSSHLTPTAPGADPAQQKIMKFMPLMLLAFFYNMAAGLTLYWTVQNLLTIAQMKMTNAKITPTATGVAPKKKR